MIWFASRIQNHGSKLILVTYNHYPYIPAHCLFYPCRHHVFSDIMPYVCTFVSCPRPGHLYGSRGEWFEHELQAHRREWHCETCNLTFGHKKDIIKHMGDKHKEELPESEYSAVAEWSERVQSSKQACPHCPRNPYPTGEHLELFHSNDIAGGTNFSTTAEPLLNQHTPSPEIKYDIMGGTGLTEKVIAELPKGGGAKWEWSESVQSSKQACPLCPLDFDPTQEHFEQFHNNDIAGSVDFSTAAEQLLKQDTSSCPYCPVKVEIEYEMTQLRRHLGYHLQQIALFTLPRRTVDESEDGQESKIADRGDSDSGGQPEPSSKESGIKATKLIMRSGGS